MYTLITAAASARAHRLKNSLNKSSVLLGDYTELPEIMVKRNAMLVLPNPAQDNYPHLMLAFCLDNNITSLYLMNTEEMEGLVNASQLFNEYGINLLAGYDQI